MDLSVVPYGHISSSARAEGESNPVEKNGPGKIRYRECLRNHAASMGGHANDGCGEFMPGEEEPLKCAACGCHRNFHRKEVPGYADQHFLHPHHHHHHHHPMVLYNAWDKKMPLPHLQPHPMLPVVDLRPQQQNRRSETPEDREGQGTTRKRFRTKFTQEQKEKMQAFAEKLGWRIQKHDDVALQQFCMEVGVKRHVLKVWMHNNKNTLGKKDAPPITV
ncbi:zinc-finger homeodomain protein 2-like [Magnolia sinica]|uniref:zinc-finger homeodomain protein 2-like n=1 Tax=Magnolia sinica TaxID=86752 RepID=UPI002658122C|nr:zinc-finger homeodomain protein 2-like [Magnolia sinica]